MAILKQKETESAYSGDTTELEKLQRQIDDVLKELHDERAWCLDKDTIKEALQAIADKAGLNLAYLYVEKSEGQAFVKVISLKGNFTVTVSLDDGHFVDR